MPRRLRPPDHDRQSLSPLVAAWAIAEPGDIHLIERAFCRLEDWRRIATNDAIAIAIVVIWRA